MNERTFRVIAKSGQRTIHTEEGLRELITNHGLSECLQIVAEEPTSSIDQMCECGSSHWVKTASSDPWICAACSKPLPEMSRPESAQPARVTRISFGRTYNLGNYENQRLDVSVDVPEGESAADVLKQLEQLFAEVDPKNEKEDYAVKEARALLATPLERIEHGDVNRVQAAKQTIAEHQTRKARMKTARSLLDHLGAQSEYKDGKWQWEDSDDGSGIPF